jgi:hypothetical protein
MSMGFGEKLSTMHLDFKSIMPILSRSFALAMKGQFRGFFCACSSLNSRSSSIRGADIQGGRYSYGRTIFIGMFAQQAANKSGLACKGGMEEAYAASCRQQRVS